MSQETWNRLAEAAVRYAATRDIHDGEELRDTAEADTRARWSEKSGKAGEHKTRGQGVVRIPQKFGRCGGMAVHELDTKDLDWYRGAIARSIDDPEKAKFRDNNQTLLDAIDAERATR